MRDGGDIVRVARTVVRSSWCMLRARGGVPVDSCRVFGRLSIGILGRRTAACRFACGRGVVGVSWCAYGSTTTPKSVVPTTRGAWEGGGGQKTRRDGIRGAYA